MSTCDETTKQAIHPMLQCNVSHVSWLCCYFILVILLPCCHVSRYEKFMLHSHVALLPFISNQVWNKQNLRMLHMCVSVTMAWWHRWCICLWNEMQFCGSQTPRVLHWSPKQNSSYYLYLCLEPFIFLFLLFKSKHLIITMASPSSCHDLHLLHHLECATYLMITW